MNKQFVIDPFNLTDYHRDNPTLETFILFSLAVAGKRADVQSRKVAAFLADLAATYGDDCTPFELVKHASRCGTLEDFMKRHRLGKYTLLGRGFREAAALDVSRIEVSDLERLHGMRPKSARLVMLHSFADARLAALDTHILQWMNTAEVRALCRKLKCPLPRRMPRSSPNAGPLYQRIEAAFLKLADWFGKTPAALDLEIWKSRTLSRPVEPADTTEVHLPLR